MAGFTRELVSLGARGALLLGHSIEIPIATFAAHAAGAQAVPINPAYTRRALSHIPGDCEAAVVIHDADVAPTAEPLAASLKIPHLIKLGTGARTLVAWTDERTRRLPEPLPAPDELASLQYAGGATGLPKGANITHGLTAVNASQREAALPTRPEDESVLCVTPRFHVFALALCLPLAACCRGKLAILPRYRPALVFERIQREHNTPLPAGPTVLIGLLSHALFAGADFSSLRTAYSDSAPLPEETLKRWHALTATPILEGFGQTEARPPANRGWGRRSARRDSAPVPG